MMEVFDGKQTNWEGLWWHPEYCGFSSQAIKLSELKKFKGQVRLYVRKNKFFNGGENSRPNYLFCIKASNSSTFHEVEIEDDDEEGKEKGERLYTEAEVRQIINGVAVDVRDGYDAYDLLPSDYV